MSLTYVEAASSTNGSAAFPHQSAAAYIREARSRWRSVTTGPRGRVEGPRGLRGLEGDGGHEESLLKRGSFQQLGFCNKNQEKMGKTTKKSKKKETKDARSMN